MVLKNSSSTKTGTASLADSEQGGNQPEFKLKKEDKYLDEQRNNLEGQNGYSDLFKLLQIEPCDSQENRIDLDSVIDHLVNNPQSEHLIEEQQEKMSFSDGEIINLKLLKHSVQLQKIIQKIPKGSTSKEE